MRLLVMDQLWDGAVQSYTPLHSQGRPWVISSDVYKFIEGI